MCVCVCVLRRVSEFFVSHLFEVTHSFSLIRHVYRARIGVHHPVSLFSHPAFHSPGHPFSGVLEVFLFSSVLFSFYIFFVFCSLSLIYSISSPHHSFMAKTLHLLTPPPTNNNSHTRPNNIDPIDPSTLKQPVNQFLQHRPRTSLVPA